MRRFAVRGQTPLLIHLGDHDPSGIDMSRDIEERIRDVFRCHKLEFRRIALNMDQVEELNPPRNPAKLTDSRARDYIALYGEYSWELDAIPPTTLSELVQTTLDSYKDQGKWEDRTALQEQQRSQLQQVSDQWDDVILNLDPNFDNED